MAGTQTGKGFGKGKPAAQAAGGTPAAGTRNYDDHYADVTQMQRADGRTSKYIKFVKDINDPATGLFIPKGTIFDFETFQDIYDRTEQPSEKMLEWLNGRQAPFTTATGAVLTGIGQVKRPFKPAAQG